MRRALVTGVSGQDGSYLAELLLAKGYRVFGLVRRSSNEQLERIAHLQGKIELVRGDPLRRAHVRGRAVLLDLPPLHALRRRLLRRLVLLRRQRLDERPRVVLDRRQRAKPLAVAVLHHGRVRPEH